MTGRISTDAPRTRTRNDCLTDAAAWLVRGVARRASMTPREAAEAAFYPGHPLGSVEAVEAEIIRRRKLRQVAAPKAA